MIRFDFSVDVERPTDEVFTYLTDPEKLPQWQTMILEASKQTPGPVSEGTKLSQVGKFLGRRIEMDVEVTRFEPNQRATFESKSGPIPLSIDHKLQPAGNGTRIAVQVEGEPGNFFKMAEPLVGRMAERQFKNEYNNLKELLEADATAP